MAVLENALQRSFDALGSQGVLAQAIGQTTWSYLMLVLTLGAGAWFLTSIATWKENIGRAFAAFMIIGVVSMYWTGNPYSWVIVFLLIFGLHGVANAYHSHAELPRGSEYRDLITAGLQAREDRKLAQRERRESQTQRGKGKLANSLFETEASFAETEAEVIGIQDHTTATAVETAQIAQIVEKLIHAESSVQQRDQAVTTMIQKLDNQLTNLDPDQHESVAFDYVSAYVKRLVELLGELARDSRYSKTYREKAVGLIQRAQSIALHAAERAKRLEGHLKRVERQLAKHTGEEIKLFKLEIQENLKSMHAAQKQTENKEALKAIKERQHFLQQQIASLDKLNNYLMGVLRNLRKEFTTLKHDFTALSALEEHASQSTQLIQAHNKVSEQHDKQLKIAHAKLQTTTDQATHTKSPDALVAATTTSSEAFFSAKQQYLQEISRIYFEDISGYFDDLLSSLALGENIERSLYYVTLTQQNLNKVFQQLATFCDRAISGKEVHKEVQQLLKSNKLQDIATRREKWNQTQAVRFIKQAQTVLQNANQRVATLSQLIKQDVTTLEHIKNQTTSALIRSLQVLAKRQGRSTEVIQHQSKAAVHDLERARSAARTARRAA